MTRVFDINENLVSDCLFKLFNVEYLEINCIIVDEKDRIRTSTGKNIKDLKESINELGLFHPIIVNKDLKLVSGYRRFKACKDLGWNHIPAIIRRDIDELEEINIELHENIRRKNLAPYEIDIAFAKWKKIYEKLHPEVKHLAHAKSENRDKKGRIQKRDQEEENTTWNYINETQSDKINQPKRFTQIAAEYTKLSERTIRGRAQIGEALLQKKFDEETIKLYKENKVSHSFMLKKDRERRKSSKEFKAKKQRRIKDKEGSVKRGTSYEIIGNSNIINSTMNINWCKNCKNATLSTCPDCRKQLIICNKGYYMLRSIDSKGCKNFIL
ncbi:MAG: ParB/RepB/Spo0J family partition protein [Candidatus Hermodarchaeota archaeon]